MLTYSDVNTHRIRADVEREMAAKLEVDMQARLRTLGDSIRMESLQTIRSRDVQIAELKEQAHKLDAMLLLMLDRTVLEQVVRNERKQREEECQQAQRATAPP
jgi:hypothetical protein